MDIIIGALPPVQFPPSKPREENSSGMVEARLLHSRPPRKGIAGPSGMERRGKKSTDPHRARVLTIMVPDATTLPPDLDEGKYAVYLRFVRK
ncbi:MAG: hypothetical protein LBU39_02320 [Desulfobulbaceae bacterium]|jgi:hypothetical protein|nr:hypothetical protein [Desulfobulbaceae bacterium]